MTFEQALRAGLAAEGVAMGAPSGGRRDGALAPARGPIEAGGRDVAGVSEAGGQAGEVLAGRAVVWEAVSAVGQCHARMKGPDKPDLAKYVGKFFEFLRKDCVVIDAKTGEERQVLPYGWDDGLSWTEKVQWGLDQVETAYGERWIARWFVLIAKTGQLVDTRTGEMSEIEVVLRGGVGLYVSYHPRWGQECTVRQHRGLKRVAYAKMCPGKPPGIIKDGGYDVWNTYRGWAVSAAEGVCDVDVEPFLRLVRMQVPDFAGRRHLLDWTAHIFQHPEVKPMHAVVMISEMQGVGKNTYAGCVGDLMHPDHRATTTMDGLEAPFNAQYIRDKLFVFGDELYFKPKSDVPNRLKTLITSETVIVSEKYAKSYEQNNYTRFFGATNKLNALQIDKDDRRYFVLWITDADAARIQREFDFTAFREWWENPTNRMKLLGWFLDRDLSKFQAKARPPMTTGKEVVSGLNVPRWEDTLQHALDSQAGPFGKPIVTVEAVVAFLEEKKERKTPTYVRHWLRRAGAVPVAERAWVARQGAGGGKLQTTVWAVRDAEHWRAAGMTAVVAEMVRRAWESPADQVTREAGGTMQVKNAKVTHLDTKIR